MLEKPARTSRRISSFRTHDDAQDCVVILMKGLVLPIFEMRFSLALVQGGSRVM